MLSKTIIFFTVYKLGYNNSLLLLKVLVHHEFNTLLTVDGIVLLPDL